MGHRCWDWWIGGVGAGWGLLVHHISQNRVGGPYTSPKVHLETLRPGGFSVPCHKSIKVYINGQEKYQFAPPPLLQPGR